jgi:thiol-disulfide isomerase/thioredoxin
MNRTTIAAIGTLVLLGGLVAAAAATAPSGEPEVGALPAVETPSNDSAGDDADAQDTPTPDEPATNGAPANEGSLAMRPSGPTGKPGGDDAPSFTGLLSAAQIPEIRDNPGLTDLDGWLQADGVESLDDLDGQVRVVWFWTFACSNCKATIPNLQALLDDHADRDDFSIVSVHYPEFAFEEAPADITQAAADLGVTWPIALDTRGTNFHEWQEGSSGYWPRTYVLDRDGDIRFDHVGEGRYDELNATVAALLAEE